MKHKVNEKVKYENGEWLFTGTVTAIIDNSICPLYRIKIERMEKKDCRFPISLFEFELQPDYPDDGDDNYRNLETLKLAFLQKHFPLHNKQNLRAPMSASPMPATPFQQPQPAPPKIATITQPIPIQVTPPSPQIPNATNAQPKPKKTDVWSLHFEAFRNGVKGTTINNWCADIRRQYRAGKLKDERFNKLKEINFPFESPRKSGKKPSPIPPTALINPQPIPEPVKPIPVNPEPSDAWHKQYRQWQTGANRASLQKWRQTNVRRYLKGKLSNDKIQKLKEIGILK